MGTLIPIRRARPEVFDAPDGDDDLLPIAVLVWIVSLARVVAAFAAREVFGAEATLALLVLVMIPWLALSTAGAKRRVESVVERATGSADPRRRSAAVIRIGRTRNGSQANL